MDYNKLADLLYPNVKVSMNEYLKKYAKRELPAGAEVTRIAPSPTGYLHIGTVYGALIDFLLAKNSNGKFYMRLEDTDSKREVENAGTIAYDMLCVFGLTPDEGYTGDGRKENGEYGPYVQSMRTEIYESFAKELVKKGRAFPCFCEKKNESKLELQAKREEQLAESGDLEQKDPCRDLTFAEIERNIKENKPFSLRLLSVGDGSKTFEFKDEIKGKREIRENEKDIVLMKSNGIPPYAFAHLVDDTLMGTTTVVRGEEWYPSLSAHIELFKAFGFALPKYAHTPVICKLDADGNKRKLSKRKDPEADSRFFIAEGYPILAVLEYLLNLLNSDFELWRAKNPTASIWEFPFSVNKIGSNNPMFDFNKLSDISKTYISKLTTVQAYVMILEWAKVYNPEFAKFIQNNEKRTKDALSIDRYIPKPRKDISKWSDVPELFGYFYSESFEKLDSASFEWPENFDKKLIKPILSEYAKIYSEQDTKEEWFARVKEIAGKFGCATDMKEFKKNPELFSGSVADVSMLIRLALTGKKTTPDLFEIAKLLGQEEVSNRLLNTKI